jgi:hypothetical protein
MHIMKALEFKAKCLHLMDEIIRTGEEITITKNGKPVSVLKAYRVVPETTYIILTKPPIPPGDFFSTFFGVRPCGSVAKSNCNTCSPPLQLLILPKGLPQAIRQRSQDVVHGRAFARFDHDFGPHAGIQLTSVELLHLRGIDGNACQEIRSPAALIRKAVGRDTGQFALQHRRAALLEKRLLRFLITTFI